MSQFKHLLIAAALLLCATLSPPTASAEDTTDAPPAPEEICIRQASCGCRSGCVTARPSAPPPGRDAGRLSWYQLTSGPDADAFMIRAPVCLLPEHDPAETCFDALEQETCTGSCVPTVPDYDCAVVEGACVRVPTAP